MKKFLAILILVLSVCFIVSCGDEAIDNNEGEETVDGYPKSVITVFAQARDLGYEGTLEEFLAYVKGADGKDGRGVDDITIYNGDLLVHLTDNTIINLGPITAIGGNDGEDGETPYIGTNGNWWIGTTDTGVKAEGKDGVDGEDGETPYIGTNGNWWIGTTDTGVKAEAQDGVDGVDGETPYIGTNGNWWIGTTDTGVKAEGKDGVGISNVEIDADGNLIITFTDGQTKNLGKVTADGNTSGGTACNHVYSDWIEGPEATCTSLGYNSRVCGNCGVLDYDFKVATGHKWNGSMYVLSAPTSTTDGTYLVNCSVCSVSTLVTATPSGDEDGDGITNGDETSLFKTSFVVADTDRDGLTDYEEVFTYGTDPLIEDTDGDGATDLAEVTYGTDPLVASTDFDVEKTFDTNDMVSPGIQVSGLTAEQLNSLEITSNDYFEEETLGYMGQAYDYNMDNAENVNAVVTFDMSSQLTPAPAISLLSVRTTATSDPLPTIYRYEADSNSITPIPTTVENNIAFANVTQFGTYILLDRRLYEEELKWVETGSIGYDKQYTALELVLVIDDSGSMTSNDSSNKRLTVAQDLIDKLPENSKVAVVQFTSTTTPLLSLTDNRELAKSYLTTSYFKSSGNTYMYNAINSSFSMFSNSEQTMKLMVVLSDGATSDTSSHSSTVSTAVSQNVSICTVGLGSSTTYFDNYLKPLASGTKAEYRPASNASELAGIYDNIGTWIDMTVDTDGDLLPDYYEENMVSFDGYTGIVTDKNVKDTDGDRLYDGEEIEVLYIYNEDKTKITFFGKIYSDPTKKDTDGDGVDDLFDRYPLDATRD